MTPGISSGYYGSGATNHTSSTKDAAQTGAADKNMFLKLMVAQLRNQDPLNPSDGAEFIAQLAQFQSLEQAINTGQDIAAMRKDMGDLLAIWSPT
jgi:flagellar basal-body rod modification protein FlgD